MGLEKEQPPFARREGVYYSPRFYLLTALQVFPGTRTLAGGCDLLRKDLTQRNENDTTIQA